MLDVLALEANGDRAFRRLGETLAADGLSVRLATQGPGVEHTARSFRPGAVVFDASASGAAFLARMRRDNPAHVLVAWTATASSATAAALLEAGADEVVHAAMTDREVSARIANALRRAGKRIGAPVELAALRIDPLHGEATWQGRDLALSRREREVLEVLAEHAGRTVRREILYRRVWGYAMPRGERSVDVNVKRIRRKLAATAGDGMKIKTQPGVGYRLEVVPAEVPDPVTAV